jgi:hypothetical protein
MANDMVAIKASKLPAHLQGRVKVENAFANAMSAGGFPVVSIKGKVFHIQRGDERTLVTRGEDDEPVSSLTAVVLATNPNKSKVYYDHGYEEGSVAKPTCYSNDGLAPAADAESPQAKKCQACPHNQWGSRITDNGGKGKACGDFMRLAIAPPDQLNDPMLIRVPAASLKTLGAYGAQLAKRGVTHRDVITKIGFDFNVAHPALTFKAVDFVDAAQFEEIECTLVDEADTIAQIIGTASPAETETEAKADDAPREYPKEVKATKKVEEVVEEAEAAPKPQVKVEKTASVDEYDDIDEALDDLDFDDD